MKGENWNSTYDPTRAYLARARGASLLANVTSQLSVGIFLRLTDAGGIKIWISEDEIRIPKHKALLFLSAVTRLFECMSTPSSYYDKEVVSPEAHRN